MLALPYAQTLMKFDEQILMAVSRGEALQNEIDDLGHRMRDMGNNFSAKLTLNSEITTLIRRYSDIVDSWEGACKELASLDSELEKSMQIEGNAPDIIRDVRALMGEAETNLNFKLDFEEGGPFLFEVLRPTLNRLIETGKTLHHMVQEVLTKPHRRAGRFDVLLDKIIKYSFWLFPGGGFVFLLYGFFTGNRDTLIFGAILILSSLVVFLLIEWDQRAKRNKGT